MVIEPDQKEIIWYKLDELVSIDPDALPHYWEVLSQKHLELEYALEQDYGNNEITYVLFCLTCGNSDIIEHKKKLYCDEDYELVNGKPEKKRINKDHNPVLMRATDLVKHIINGVLDNLIEEDEEYRMTLYELESFLSISLDSDFFDTKKGEITKGQVKSQLHKIKQFLIIRLAETRSYIRFSSQMRTPSIKI